MSYLWLPYMILPLYAGLERIPDSLLDASGDLGGRPWRTFRSVVLPGSIVGERCVVGAQSVVRGSLSGHSVWAGNPVKLVREVSEPHPTVQHRMLLDLLGEYERFCQYRGWPAEYLVSASGNRVAVKNCLFNVKTLTCEGEECIFTDDFRDFMFRRGLRFYTQRPFRRMAGTRIERNKP
jgi:hypothetical protein